ncbi:MAG: hypothetical protein JSV90_06445 [Methanobacteriota archaeon]|nr:MAG: hypothetical protein JSV90_06445 [Euryarchaeota archaeon]
MREPLLYRPVYRKQGGFEADFTAAFGRVVKPGGRERVLEPTRSHRGMPVDELSGLMAWTGFEEVSADVRKSSYRGTFAKVR